MIFSEICTYLDKGKLKVQSNKGQVTSHINILSYLWNNHCIWRENKSSTISVCLACSLKMIRNIITSTNDTAVGSTHFLRINIYTYIFINKNRRECKIRQVNININKKIFFWRNTKITWKRKKIYWFQWYTKRNLKTRYLSARNVLLTPQVERHLRPPPTRPAHFSRLPVN